ncbi:hypothetical protein FNV43_RR17638 [Rhamnella rubrinervis]|uniref:Uncharacterized protein n=1 Tax=Rhamnella rubrinervis TaxID=2594499 RepID=A0A8K0GVJ7_9ROSA|nr:hypothetical protein FNV43_RR17638 [Rhamnella rubrinervis]
MDNSPIRFQLCVLQLGFRDFTGIVVGDWGTYVRLGRWDTLYRRPLLESHLVTVDVKLKPSFSIIVFLAFVLHDPVFPIFSFSWVSSVNISCVNLRYKHKKTPGTHIWCQVLRIISAFGV